MRDLRERLLLLLSRPPDALVEAGDEADDPEEAATGLLRDFPDLPDRIRGKRIVDFGCGVGRQAVALALLGAAQVLALDIDQDFLAAGRLLAEEHGVAQRIRFATAPLRDDLGAQDMVVSINSMEHFSAPAAILATMASLLRPGGRLLVSFSPTWYSPWGAHMHYFTRVPWVHLLFPESVVMSVRSRYRDDGARRYEEVRGGLNRMSVNRFERLLAASGLTSVRMEKVGVRGIRAFARVPVLRELLVPKVICESCLAAGADRAPGSRSLAARA